MQIRVVYLGRSIVVGIFILLFYLTS